MSYRQFIWGLSNGVIVLGMAGAFWFGLAASSAGHPLFLVSMVLIAACFGAIIVAAIRLRRKARGFKLSELQHGEESQRAQTRKIVLGFRWVSLGQVALIWFTGSLCYHFGRMELMWPLIGLIASLHFIPLARIFKVRAYYVLGIVGAVISLAAIRGLAGSERPVFLGVGIGLDVWLTAAYLVWNADRIAAQASVVGKS